MPREINVQVEMEMDMNQITKDIVDTLNRNPRSQQAEKLAQVISNQISQRGSNRRDILGQKVERR